MYPRFYYVCILTNRSKTLYLGVTSSFERTVSSIGISRKMHRSFVGDVRLANVPLPQDDSGYGGLQNDYSLTLACDSQH